MPPKLVVSIDTEEEGLWGGDFESHPSTENLRGLDRFQQFCDDRHVLPTYLIDAPAILDDWAVGRFKAWQEEERCEIGAHCHPWCNPPLDGKLITGPSTFMCNLPEPDQRQKLEWLTEKIEEKVGRRPTSFRAGRYGMDHVGVRILADLGYVVDSSVLPFRDYSDQSGPDYRDAPMHPYRMSDSNLLKSDPAGRVLEVPITSGFTRSGFRNQHRCLQWLTKTPVRKLRIAGILDRLRVMRRVKLSPEQANVEDNIRLVDAAINEGVKVLVLMLHSSSLAASFSPYVKNETELQQFYDRLDKIIHHCMHVRGCETMTLSNLAQSWQLP